MGVDGKMPDSADVGDQLTPSVLAEEPEPVRRWRAVAVAAVVMAVHDVTVRQQVVDQRAVAQGVLPHSVGDLRDGARRAVRIPAVGRDARAGAVEIETGGLRAHVISSGGRAWPPI